MLGVPPDATAKQVRRAYKRLARRVHPDAGPAGSAERFKAVKAAHDEMLRRIEAGEPVFRAPPPPPARPQPEVVRPAEHYVRPIDLPGWDRDLEEVAYWEFGRVALYGGAALFWLSMFWLLTSTLQRGCAPPPEPDSEQTVR